MNAIVSRPAGTGLISREDLAKSLNNAAMAMPTVGGDKAFLKMDKATGDWLFGQEETVVEDDSLWAANPLSLKHGWVAWDTNAGGAPVQEIMVPINRPLPPIESLPELGLGTADKKSGARAQLTYQRQQSVDFVCVKGEDEGTTVEYKQSSTGAMKLFANLTNALLDQVQRGDEIVAVGQMTFDSYKHKQYGKINNPIFKIVEWRTMDDTAPVVESPKTPETVAYEQQDDARRAAVRADADKAKAKEMARERYAEAAKGAVGTVEDLDTEVADEEAALAAEYAATAAAETPAPRRRVRR